MEAKHQNTGYDKKNIKKEKKEQIMNIVSAEKLKIESIANKSKEAVAATEGEAKIVGIVNEMIEEAKERTIKLIDTIDDLSEEDNNVRSSMATPLSRSQKVRGVMGAKGPNKATRLRLRRQKGKRCPDPRTE